jgi:cytochrome d ubiquinol oxidase subunit I
MVGLGFSFLFIFAAAFWFLSTKNLAPQRWLLWLCVYAIPLPWVAAEMGWIVAEYGRQPWTISGILPTHLSISQLDKSQIYFSMIGLLSIYSFLFVIEMYLMIKYIRLGPASLHTGRYDGEENVALAHQGADHV